MNECQHGSREGIKRGDSFRVTARREQQDIENRFAIGRSFDILAEKKQHEQQLESVDSHRFVVCENVKQREMAWRKLDGRESGLEKLGELRIEHVIACFVRSAERRKAVQQLRGCERVKAVVGTPLPRQILND